MMITIRTKATYIASVNVIYYTYSPVSRPIAERSHCHTDPTAIGRGLCMPKHNLIFAKNRRRAGKVTVGLAFHRLCVTCSVVGL